MVDTKAAVIRTDANLPIIYKPDLRCFGTMVYRELIEECLRIKIKNESIGTL